MGAKASRSASGGKILVDQPVNNPILVDQPVVAKLPKEIAEEQLLPEGTPGKVTAVYPNGTIRVAWQRDGCAADQLDDVEGGVETVVNVDWVAAVDAHVDRCVQAPIVASILWSLQWDVRLQLTGDIARKEVKPALTVSASSLLSGSAAGCFGSFEDIKQLHCGKLRQICAAAMDLTEEDVTLFRHADLVADDVSLESLTSITLKIGVRSNLDETRSKLDELKKDAERMFEENIQILEDESDAIRKSAVIALGRMSEAAARYADVVARLLQQDQSQTVQIAAATALNQMGDARAAHAAELVANRLQDDDCVVRKAAAAALGQMGDDGARYAERLAVVLKDKDVYVRAAAVATLGQMGDIGAQHADVIASMVEDPSNEVRIAALLALGQIGDARVTEKAEKILANEGVQQHLMRMENVGTAANVVDMLARLLEAEDRNLRERVLATLERMGDIGGAGNLKLR